MDKKSKNMKTQDSTRKTTRNGLLKSLMGNVVTENSPTHAEAP